ncbi:hypothetical protein SAMN05880501_101254 [Ureibacillus xyleni]|uniref:YviE n=1 Tax=Ureibacillus xyleni TaxID=614648 RepID=A0A285RBA8_9BACL|nr:DUF6470 family protein [Ureibacillus xyleni]SOB91038.1 hypothetical protein SAMN05880501_101254 [Ureibacillus xyleni]
MDFPKLQIRKTDIKLDMQIHDPIQRISQPKATQTIEQPAAIIEISSKEAQLKIDSSQARRDLGLLGPLESLEKYSKDGKQAQLKMIAKTAQEGRQMMMSAGKGQGRSIIANIAKQNHGPHRTPINIKFIPSIGSVKIDYVPGNLDINVTPQKPRIDAQVNKPIHDYKQGKVTHDVVQRPSIDIDFIM